MIPFVGVFSSRSLVDSLFKDKWEAWHQARIRVVDMYIYIYIKPPRYLEVSSYNHLGGDNFAAVGQRFFHWEWFNDLLPNFDTASKWAKSKTGRAMFFFKYRCRMGFFIPKLWIHSWWMYWMNCSISKPPKIPIIQTNIWQAVYLPFGFKSPKLVQCQVTHHLGFRRRGAAFVCVPHLRARYCQRTVGRGWQLSMENVRQVMNPWNGRNRWWWLSHIFLVGRFLFFFWFRCKKRHDSFFFFLWGMLLHQTPFPFAAQKHIRHLWRLLWFDFSRLMSDVFFVWNDGTSFQVLSKWMDSFSKPFIPQ